MSGDIAKEDLYESVKQLIESDEKHLHFDQHKLFTLVSIAFQYLLFKSTKEPGAYIIRVEDAKLADKIARKAKDPSTRKFFQQLLMPRKIKFQKSMIYLDFFNLNTWNMTADIPKGKIKGALIIKDSGQKPMDPVLEVMDEAEQEMVAVLENLPKDYYLQSLIEAVPETITVAFEHEFSQLNTMRFPFIVKDRAKTISGVTLGTDVDWEKLD